MSKQYDEYLEQHKANVKKGLDWIRDNLPELIENCSDDLEWQIGLAHDESKTFANEYDAYDAYFYGGNRSYKVVQEFNKAWLAHIHKNPHHWQHWVLIHDEPEPQDITILEMPYNYIIEMICDWWSFSWKSGDLKEIIKWYNEHKDHMKLHDKTRKTVEDILSKIEDKLTSKEADENDQA